MKFQKDILNGFHLREQTRFYDKVHKEIIPKEETQELWFLHSALSLVLTDIYMKFIENIMNRFQFIVQTRNCVTKFQRNYSKSVNARVMVLALCRSSNVDRYL